MKLREEKKLQSRSRILRSAAQLFRRKGIAATGVDKIMGKAGLTAGGFYAHFKSKDELVAMALESVLRNSKTRLVNGNKSHNAVDGVLDVYLSESHRDQPERGCVLAALAGEIPRQTNRIRRIVAHHLESWISDLEKAGLSRDQAIRSVSLAIGSLILSRMTKGSELSDEILKAARKFQSKLTVT